METHAGAGKIWSYCYAGIEDGVAFEKNPAKADILARQRPSWAVYECDVVAAVGLGAGSHLPANVLDIDPYGEPWPVIDAFFTSDRPWPSPLAIVVNDGLRQKLKMGGGWTTGSMAEVVGRVGNAALYDDYLAICRTLLEEKAGSVGYRLDHWAGRYTGHAQQMTHYAGIFSRVGGLT